MDCTGIAKYLPQGARRFLINKTAGDNAAIHNLIQEERDVNQAFSNFVKEQSQAVDSLAAWSLKEEEILAAPLKAYHENMKKINEYAGKWSAEYAAYISEIENILSQVKAADALKGKQKKLNSALESAKKKMDKFVAAEKNPGGKPTFDAAKAKADTADAKKVVERTEADLADVTEQLNAKVAELTTFKAVHIKAGLLRLTNAYVEYHKQTAALMEAQIPTIEAIPGEVTPEMLLPAEVPKSAEETNGDTPAAEGDAANDDGIAVEGQSNGNHVAADPASPAKPDSPDVVSPSEPEPVVEQEAPKSPEPVAEEEAPKSPEAEAEDAGEGAEEGAKEADAVEGAENDAEKKEGEEEKKEGGDA